MRIQGSRRPLCNHPTHPIPGMETHRNKTRLLVEAFRALPANVPQIRLRPPGSVGPSSVTPGQGAGADVWRQLWSSGLGLGGTAVPGRGTLPRTLRCRGQRHTEAQNPWGLVEDRGGSAAHPPPAFFVPSDTGSLASYQLAGPQGACEVAVPWSGSAPLVRTAWPAWSPSPAERAGGHGKAAGCRRRKWACLRCLKFLGVWGPLGGSVGGASNA